MQLTYDARGRLSTISQGDRSYTLAYVADGFLSAVTDALARALGFSRDAVGRITALTRPDGQQIRFDHDARGNVTCITPAGSAAHTFTFTATDLAASHEPPSLGGPPTGLQAVSDLDRQLTQLQRAGSAIAVGRDAAGRVNSVTHPHDTVTLTYDTAGRIQTVTSAGGVALTYAYDGRVPTDTTWTGPVAGTVRRTFDNNFRLAGRTINGANAQSFTHDTDGLLTQAGALTLQRHAQSGLVTGTTLGTVTDTRTFTGFGERATYSASAGATPLFSAQYTYDRGGRMTQKVETVGVAAARTLAYGYDLAGRLVEVKVNGTTTATYAYDANGNRLSRTTAGGVVNGTHDAQDRLVQYGASTYTYTDGGDLLTRTAGGQLTTYTYDALGGLRAVALPGGSQIEYLIDGLGRRVGKKVDGVQVQGFLYRDHLKPIAELDGSNAVVATFVYGVRPSVPEYMVKAGATYRIIADHPGSPRLVVNTATGAVAQELDYDEFGQVTRDTSPGFQPFGFAGGLLDRDTGLVRFGARDYAPETGRWTSKDAAGLQDGFNLYAYAAGDPVNSADLTGRHAAASTALDIGIKVTAGALGGAGSAFIALGLIAGTALAGALLAAAALESSATLHADEIGDDEGPKEGGAPKEDEDAGAGGCPTPLVPQGDTEKSPPPDDELTDDFLRNPKNLPGRGPTPKIPYPETPEDGFEPRPFQKWL